MRFDENMKLKDSMHTGFETPFVSMTMWFFGMTDFAP